MDGIMLLKQLRAGDKAAINILYEKYSGRIYRFAFGYLKSEDDARDVLQEVFLKLWANKGELKKDSNLEAFLFTIAKNTIVTSFRKKISEKEYLEHLRSIVVKNSADTEKQVDYTMLSEKVQQLIDKLPEQRQRVYLLSKEKGFSNKDIAADLQISIKTVEDHITKARRFLKESLKEYGFLAVLFYEMFV